MREQQVAAYISLGSNMGDREGNLAAGAKEIGRLDHTEIVGVSSLYCTAPVGYLEQDEFYNAVLAVNTRLEPIDLLHSILAIETKLGRVRTIRWGPRVIDLDLLIYGEESINLPELVVPHPRLLERAFVLVPLAELVPDLQIAEKTIKQAVKHTSSQKIFLFKPDWFGKI